MAREALLRQVVWSTWKSSTSLWRGLSAAHCCTLLDALPRAASTGALNICPAGRAQPTRLPPSVAAAAARLKSVCQQPSCQYF